MFLVPKNACQGAMLPPDSRIAMARPTLPSAERRDDRLPNLRVTAAERAEIERRAEEAGLTLVEYCRHAIFKTKIPPRRASVDQALLVELNRIGVNLNQIAHAVNSDRALSPAFPVVVEEIRTALSTVLADGS